MPAWCDTHGGGEVVRQFIEGSHAVAEAVRLCRVQVIAAYPITPQTHISERLAELTANRTLPARFIMVESEHSAMACCIGAASTGVRVFTATSSHGLALMHEMLHWASGARLPIVMTNVNRALGPPWNLWADQTDSLSQRDTGWLQFYCESGQEAMDTVISAYRISEKIQLPTMVNLDAFILSHMNEPVTFPDPEQVDAYLPPRNAPFKLDVDNPFSYGLMTSPENYMEFRFEVQKAMENALEAVRLELKEFSEKFGRTYKIVETYRADDTDTILVVSGTMAGTCREAVNILREKGRKVGMAKVKLFRPFPAIDIETILGDRKILVVVDRNLSPGMGGIFAQEIRACLGRLKNGPRIIGAIAGLGGRDVTEQELCELAEDALADRLEEDRIQWINLKQV